MNGAIFREWHDCCGAGMVGRSVDPQMTLALTAQIICHIGRHFSSSCCSSFMESDVAEAAHVADWKKIYCRCWCTARALVLCFLSTTDLSISTRLVYSTNKNQEVPLSSVADEYFVSYTSWNFSVSYGRSTFLQNM
ncbi:hypothetical protein MPTK2_8g17800 [Marchantia polymorpha subsp. ruderalis]